MVFMSKVYQMNLDGPQFKVAAVDKPFSCKFKEFDQALVMS